MVWKKKRDPLFRGDAAAGVALPEPKANLSIVAHVLYLGGAGRESQYQSTTESEEVANHFAGTTGRVYRTTAQRAEQHGVGHVSQVELIQLLRGKGKGRAKGGALRVIQARRFVEQWAEHLLDFTKIEPENVNATVGALYAR